MNLKENMKEEADYIYDSILGLMVDSEATVSLLMEYAIQHSYDGNVRFG